MAVSKRTREINKLNDFIWSLKGQCDSITEVNRGLIRQYRQFAVLSSEVAKPIEEKLESMDDEESDIC